MRHPDTLPRQAKSPLLRPLTPHTLLPWAAAGLVCITPLRSEQNPRVSQRNPAGIEGELDEMEERREPRAPWRGADEFFQPWYDTKAMLAEDYGLRFGTAYTPLYQVASDSLTDVYDAAGGIFEIIGTWSPPAARDSWFGTIGFRLEDRHKLGTTVAPQSLFAQVGTSTPTALGYSEFDFALAELWYEQVFIKDRFSVRFGKMLPFGFFDYFALKSPRTGFTNADIALNPSIAWPQFGLGMVTEIRPRRDIYILAGLHDANGSPTSSGFDTFFNEREFFTIAEIGWDPGFLAEDGSKDPFAPDLHATIWHTDSREKAGRPEGWGAGVTGQKAFGNFISFARYGYSDGGAAPLKHLVMGGIAWRNAFDFEQDTLGLAFGWGHPSDSSLRDQFTAEIYYKTQLTRRVAVTPTLQFFINPARNPGRDYLALLGLRVRVDL